MDTMTFSRYRALMERVLEYPTPDILLTYIAAAHGYKPPSSKAKVVKKGRGKDARKEMALSSVHELKAMFPGGTIRIGQ